MKEGLTVYRDQEFSADMGSAAVCRINDVRSLRARQFPEDGGPMAHPIRPESYIAMDNFYTATVYEKGAEVIRMYEALVGREGFRKGMDLYFGRHDGNAVTCDDFRGAMAEANGRDLTQFERWYTQAGTPTVTAKGSLDTASGTYSLTLTQSCGPSPNQETKEPFLIPVVVGLLDATSGAELVPSTTLELSEASQTFTFDDLPAATTRVIPSVLRGFSAPVRLQVEPALSDDDLAFLMAHDTDSFNRWEASQKLSSGVVLDLAAKSASGADISSEEVPSTLVTAFKATLEATDLDQSLQAYALMLPSLSELSDMMAPPVDPLALVAARKHVKKALATATADLLRSKYDALAPSGDFSIEGVEISRRTLRSLCLDYLNSIDGPARAQSQFNNADCMTDKLAALGGLVGMGVDYPSEAAAALQSFYDDAAGDALVINKWFTTQATADRDDALDQVSALLEHPDFTWSNPNRMRSLVAAFAAGNVRAFHALDGSGYAFLGDAVLTVDKLNPQIASRLTGTLSLWRRYDESRQELMKAQLQRIKDAEGVSKDTFEIASKSLK